MRVLVPEIRVVCGGEATGDAEQMVRDVVQRPVSSSHEKRKNEMRRTRTEQRMEDMEMHQPLALAPPKACSALFPY